MAMQLAQPLPGELAKPGVIGHGPGFQVSVKVLRRIEQGLLDDVRRMGPGRESPIQPHSHHPRQPVLMPNEQVLPGEIVARRRALDQNLGIGRLLDHGGCVLCSQTFRNERKGRQVPGDFFQKGDSTARRERHLVEIYLLKESSAPI
jgi:hypothetical protein